MKAHVIENGVVINSIEVESLDFMPGLIDGSTGGIGWLWDGQTLTPPPVQPPAPVVPQSVTMRQARLALLSAGLLDDVEAAVAAAGRQAQIEWEYATEVHRTWPTLVAMATTLGMTDAQLDQLFIDGSKL